MATQLRKRERVLRTIQFKDVDRIACYDILDNDGAIEYYAGERPTPQNADRVKGRAIGRCLDMTRMHRGPFEPRESADESGLVWRQERWTNWIVKRPFATLEELMPWVETQIRSLNAWRPDSRFVEQFHEMIRSAQVFFAAGAELRDDPAVLVIESGVGTDRCYSRCGLELFGMLLCMEPELCQEWLEAQLMCELRRVNAIADPRLIPVALTYDDLASKNGTLLDPAWIREYQIPRLRRLVEAWHQRDVYCLFHSDGNLMSILPDLVSAGIDGLNPIETCAGMSLARARREAPGLFLAGGIDVSQLLPLGTPEEVRARCLEAIEETDGRGYFLGSTTEIVDAVPTANVIAMLQTPHESAQNQASAMLS